MRDPQYHQGFIQGLKLANQLVANIQEGMSYQGHALSSREALKAARRNIQQSISELENKR